jgi:transcriptional regulator with XRE-family HTH domain
MQTDTLELLFIEIRNRYRFGGKLRMVRRKRGLSQTQFSKYLGVTKQAVSHWELMDNGVSEDNMHRLKMILTPEEFLSLD